MPLKGVLCDDKRHKGELFSFEECLACARNRGPRRCDNSYQVIKAMSLNQQERRDAGLSATMLTQLCPRKVILAEEEDYFEHPSDVYQRVRGTVHHVLIEQYSDGLEPYIGEVRFKKTIEVDGVEFVLTGKPDTVILDEELTPASYDNARTIYAPTTGFIIDAKSVGDTQSEWKSIKSRVAQPEHVEQVNVYHWLLRGGEAVEDDKNPKGVIRKGDVVDITILGGGIQYMDMQDQKKVCAPIWPIEQTEAFIRERVRPFAHYRATGELPPIIENLWGERHVFCRSCPLKEACDRRGREAGDPHADE